MVEFFLTTLKETMVDAKIFFALELSVLAAMALFELPLMLGALVCAILVFPFASKLS